MQMARGVAVVLVAGLTCATALAEVETGVQWAAVPVGCKIYRHKSDGTTEVDKFLGFKGGHYQLETHAGSPDGPWLITLLYNASGYIDGRIEPGGGGGRFVPYSCVAKLGDCSFTYVSQDGKRYRYNGHAVPTEGGLVASGGYLGMAPFSDATYLFGPYNIVTTYGDAQYSYHVTKMVGCDVVG